MFDAAYTKCDDSDVAQIVDLINPQLEGLRFDPIETEVRTIPTGFFPGYHYVVLEDCSAMPKIESYAVMSEDSSEVIAMNWTNTPIYELAQKAPIQLNDTNVLSYAKFFFYHVKGRHGRFIIVESVDDINWKEEPPPQARKAISKMIESVQLVEKAEDGSYLLSARMVFKNSLFKADIFVQSNGQVQLKNEELLIEDMPILDDIFGH